MLSTLWSLLNLALLIWLIVLFVRAVKLLNKEYGRPSAFLLVVGILALMGNKSDNITNTKESLAIKHPNEYLVDDIKLSPLHYLTYSITADTINDQYGCKTNFYRKVMFISPAIKWKEITTSAYPIKNGYKYFIWGTKEWCLLNISLYNESVNFEGEILRDNKWK